MIPGNHDANIQRLVPDEISMIGTTLKVTLGFKQDGQVFFEYLQEVEVNARLVAHLADYFDVHDTDVDLDLELVESQKAQDFVTKADIREEKENMKIQERESKLLNDSMVLKAQEPICTDRPTTERSIAPTTVWVEIGETYLHEWQDEVVPFSREFPVDF